MRGRALAWAGALALALVGAGLALGQSRSHAGGAATAGSANGLTTVAAGAKAAGGATVMIQGKPASVNAGAKLYAANCQTCHGARGQGGKYRGVGSEAARRGFGGFKNLILYGSERMPGYANTGLSTSDSLGALGANGYLGNSAAPTDQQIRDLMAYLQTLPQRGRGGFFGGDD